MLLLKDLAQFLFAYAFNYREAYVLAQTKPPEGPGYPAILQSPYLHNSTLEVYVAKDGVVLNELRDEPPYQWYIGGPAFMVDREPTRTPPEVDEARNELTRRGLRSVIYRIGSTFDIPSHVWHGQIRRVDRTFQKTDDETGITLVMKTVRTTLKELVSSLTFGAFGLILDIRLPMPQSQIGEPSLMKQFGVFPADLIHRRFFWHLEIHGQSDAAAWDTRLVNLRVKHDIRRDLATALSDPSHGAAGILAIRAGLTWAESYSNRLETLRVAIGDLRSALQFRSAEVEAVFQSVLEKHPLLLDVYGRCESKPRFVYPVGSASPIGKSHLEPDFLIVYPDQSYKLVEIERPSKPIAIGTGQPRSEVTQAVFQIAEWNHFIKSHYQALAERYPGIQSKCKTCVVMSRTNQEQFKGVDDIRAYVGLIREQFRIDEFLTFDDLYDRACTAYTLLSGLSPSSV